MASRIYTVPYTGSIVAANGDHDYLYINPATNKPTTLRGWIIGQTTEVGDAQEEGLRFSLHRFTASIVAPSTGGASVTPLVLDNIGGAAGFTASCGHSTVTTGTNTILMELSWNVRATPWEFWFPDPMFAPTVRNGEALVLRQQTTLTDDMTVAMTFFVEEG